MKTSDSGTMRVQGGTQRVYSVDSVFPGIERSQLRRGEVGNYA